VINDDCFPRPGTPAIADILLAVGSLVVYAVDTLFIDRAEAVGGVAEEDPKEYVYLIEQMDRSGEVARAFRRLEVLRQAKELDAAAPELPTGPFQ
jgi:hypothetical protein